MKILIVDDQEMITRSTSTYLKTKGFKDVSTLTDSREVLEAVSATKFNVVLLDLNIPHLSGKDLIAPLLVIDPDLNIIIISAMDHRDTIKECKALGALDYFIKPLDNIRLLEILHKVDQTEVTTKTSSDQA
ncbi:response regulator [Cocleimonas flava]|jgi:DNA-binding NtrC family response regulator|uniref:Response regulator receiver domain-containing protein n=1 Tax=Cocleimonas flava TaxID=634765 RepID=A0A4R1F3I4_9GAMM|nr:response regulator [Cocleimonas flava]TCJ84971.1 response regulator receiver domain-containing protein [Cocleimonas flava]